jgi:hypothetical protein
MTADEVNATYLARAAAMFPRLSGQPCVNIDANTGDVHLCKRLYDLQVDFDTLLGTCDWQDPAEDRPDELTDEMCIGSDLLDASDDWWFDIYFNWYLVFTPALVDRSLKGDHSWVSEFLRKTNRNRTIPRPPPLDDKTHLLPSVEALKYWG